MPPTPVTNLAMPVGVLFEEAMLVAALVDDHWAPARGPGLADAGAPGLGPEVSERLRGLVAKARKVVAQRVPSAASEHAALRARGWKLLRDLGATLRYAASVPASAPPASAPLGAQLARIAKGRRPEAAAAIALARDEHASLAEAHLARLSAIPAFDARWIAEARALVPALRGILTEERKRRAARAELTRDKRAAIEEIVAVVREIRAAARFVFRDDPELLRKFGSAHAQKKHAKSRAAKRAASGATRGA